MSEQIVDIVAEMREHLDLMSTHGSFYADMRRWLAEVERLRALQARTALEAGTADMLIDDLMSELERGHRFYYHPLIYIDPLLARVDTYRRQRQGDK